MVGSRATLMTPLGLRGALCACLVGLSASACTVDHIGGSVYRFTPPTTPASARTGVDPHVTIKTRINHAAELEARGDPAGALAALPSDDADLPADVRAVIAWDRDTFEYERQRRDFAGSVAVPDPHVGYDVNVAHVSLPTSPNGNDRSFVLAGQTLSADIAGLAVSVPMEVYGEHGRAQAYLGDLGLRLQQFVGRASTWPDTKLTFGLDMTIGTGPSQYSEGTTFLEPFVAVAHRFGPFAATLNVAANLAGISPYVLVNVLLHPRLIPFVDLGMVYEYAGSEASTWEQFSRTGLRLMLDARALWQLTVHTGQTVSDGPHWSARAASAGLGVSARF
jgi:hypothetical protein